MAKCNRCGEALLEDSVFCSYCGASIPKSRSSASRRSGASGSAAVIPGAGGLSSGASSVAVAASPAASAAAEAFPSDAVAPKVVAAPRERPVRLAPAAAPDSSGKVAVLPSTAPRMQRSRVLLAAGGGLGILSAILPAASFSTAEAHITAILLDAIEGRLQFVTYVIALLGSVLLYRSRPRKSQRALAWVLASSALAAALLGVFMFVAVMRGVALGSTAPEATHALSFDYTARVGAFSNLLAAVVVLMGGALKAHEERLLD